MKISFDLDDTLILGTKRFEAEKQNILQRLLGLEMIRFGTVELFNELRSKGHTIYIYTSSFRPELKTKFMFYSYGIPVNKVINQKKHDKVLGKNRNRSSKYPPAFGIDLHIDDSPGLKIEGEMFNFETIIIDENDRNWVQTILQTL